MVLGPALIIAAGMVGAACSTGPRTEPGAAAPLVASTAPATTVAGGTDWPTYHRTLDRAGFSPDTPPVHSLRRAWATTLDGQVYASPLIADGRVFVATEHNSVYALDPTTGQVRWHRNVGRPVPLSTLPCGNIDPLGITGTPVYDPTARRVYAVAETRVNGRVHHDLVGLDAATGKVLLRRSADAPNQDPEPMQQRAALSLIGGVVYVAYGGLAGDCGDYHGYVAGVPVDKTRPLAFFRVPVGREGGIWAPPGPAVRVGGALLVAVGNGDSTTNYDGSDSVTALSVPSLRKTSLFAPKQWRADNAADADLGSMGPAPLADGRVVAAGKSGEIYLLSAGKLGGIGGQLARLPGCRAFGGAAVRANVVYLPCDDGVRQVRIGPGDRLAAGWRTTVATGSPVIGGGAVWTLNVDDGDLLALDAGSGALRAKTHVGAVTRFATPAMWKSYAFVGTQAGVVATLVG